MNNIHIEFGSDLDSQSNINYITQSPDTTWLNNSYLFRCARDILKYIAKEKKLTNSIRVFMPIFCCESMVIPFELNGYEIIYYPLKTDYSIDFDYISNRIKNNDIILVENYLSLKSIFASNEEDNYLTNLKNNFNNITIIKDYTHSLKEALYNDKSIEDYSIFSVRKWASFPDGGILWSKEQLNIKYDSYNSEYFKLKKNAMDLKSDYLKSHNLETKTKFLNYFKKADSLIEKDNEIIEISDYSKQLLYSLDFVKILDKRLDNIKYLDNNTPFLNKLLNMDTCSGLYFPIYVENQKEFQKYLAQNNIYCPIIWPLADGYENFTEHSTNIISHMLCVPCDHRYSKEDLDYIIYKLKKQKTP